MAGEVIGSAYVRIRAITTGLAKDIQDGIDKGAGNVDVDSAGANIGAQLGDGIEVGLGDSDAIGDGVNESSRKANVDGPAKTLGARISRAFENAFDNESKTTSRKIGTSLTKALKKVKLPGKSILYGIIGVLAVPVIVGLVQLLTQYVFALVGQLGYIYTAATAGGAALASMDIWLFWA